MASDSGCRLCPLWEHAQTVGMKGDGPLTAKVYVVGEAPGANEDDEGIPFVGKSGVMLRGLLYDAGFPFEEVHITNAVRCRPPENRTPTPSELATCTQAHLMPELEEYQPDYVIAVGNSSLKVWGKSGITHYRGNPFTGLIKRDVTRPHKTQKGKTVVEKGKPVAKTTVFPIFHPAFALRNPYLEPVIATDLGVLRRIIDVAGQEENAEYHYVETLEQIQAAYTALVNEPILAVDIETYGIPDAFNHRNQDFKILCLSISPREKVSYVFALEHPAVVLGDKEEEELRLPYAIGMLRKLLVEGEAKCVYHNGKYDVQMLKGHLGLDVRYDHDTMVAAHLFDENSPVGLKDLARRFCGAGNYAEDIDWSEGNIPNWGLLRLYNARDTDYTRRIFEVLCGWLNSNKSLRRLYSRLLMPAVRALVDVELAGLFLDHERIVDRRQQALDRITEAEREIVECAGEQVSMAGTFPYLTHWNPGSTKQLGNVLYNVLELPVIAQTKTGAPSTDSATLTLLRDLSDHPILEKIEEWRKWKRYYGTYLDKWFKVIDDRGFVYPRYNLAGAAHRGRRGVETRSAPVTGRLSGDYQQIPRDPFLRSVVGAPDGWLFLEVDLSQIELRLIAHVSRDPTMVEAYRRGVDIHTLTAGRILQLRGEGDRPVTKNDRTLAKAVNFGFAYGMEAHKFRGYCRQQFDLHITPEEAVQFRETYFDTYAGLRDWHRHAREEVLSFQRVSSDIGRVRRLPQILSSDYMVSSGAERQAINSPIQSLASDIMLMGMIRLNDLSHIPQHRNELVVCGTMHDSVWMRVREEVGEVWAERAIEIMRTPPLKEQFGLELLVPLDSEASLGKHWTEGKSITLPHPDLVYTP